MKAKILIIGVMVLASSVSGSPIGIHIEDVEITPQVPTILDTININVLGSASGATSLVEYSEFSQDGTSLQLDLFVDVGIIAIPSTWSHLEELGPFAAESYSLSVRAFEYQDGTLKDTYTKDFVVIPEPATLLLLAIGAVWAQLSCGPKARQSKGEARLR
ncbi:MAG: PEP-CTERM sorting domain-containing protein [Planctomycetota bacterium]|jgi:hypothetical protein